MKKSSILVTIALLGFINACAWMIVERPYVPNREYSMLEFYIGVPALLIVLGFIAGLGFSIAVLIVQYVKKHINWKS